MRSQSTLAKQCSQCKATKPQADFYKNPTQPDGFNNQCKDCQRAYREAHRAEAAHRSQQWRQSNLERARANDRNRDPNLRKANKKRSYQKHKERIRAERQRYREQHPDIITATEKRRHDKRKHTATYRLTAAGVQARRRAQKRKTQVDPVNYAAILARDEARCHICGLITLHGDRHFDHVIPLSRGGTHTEDNIRVSHRLCNQRKGAKLPGE